MFRDILDVDTIVLKSTISFHLVPSPQSTPYSTISRQMADSHKSITFLNYRPESAAEERDDPNLESAQESLASHSTDRSDSSRAETRALVQVKTEDTRISYENEEQPVSLSHVDLEIAASEKT